MSSFEDTSSPTDHGEPTSHPVGAAWDRITKLTVVLFALILVAGGILGWLLYSTSAAQAAENARDEAPQVAAEQVVLMFGYDYATVRDEMDVALDGLTGTFRDTFEEEVSTNVIPRAEKNDVVSEATVVTQGAVETTKDSAKVLVYFNQEIKASTGPKATFTPSRLLVDMQKVDGRWLVSGLEAI